MKRSCKVFVTLNKYKGAQCNTSQDSEYAFEVESSGEVNGFNDGTYTLSSYYNGKQCDLVFNGWSFSSVNNGTYHLPGSYQEVRIEIDCYSPCGESVIVRDVSRDTWDYWIESAALYMNRIMLVCLFKDKKEYQSFEHLQQKHADYSSDKEALKKILNELSIFKDAIKRNENNSEIPAHFIENAKREYRRIACHVKDVVDLDKIFEALFD